MAVLRTPDERFADVPDFPYVPHYVEVRGLRMHYVDEGLASRSPGSATILCLHGEPTWSFLYRKMISPLAAKHRVVAPDFVGFGRSDKFSERDKYTFQMHRDMLAGKFEGKRLNSPNDGTFDSQGNLYFTDPPYGLEGQNKDPAKELPFNGVYRLSKDGQLTLLTQEMTFPNGIALSPDEKTLYVANSDSNKAIWMAFDIQPNGTIAGGRVFFDATQWAGKKKGLPDGMKVDAQGNLFATGPGGVWVFSPQGKHLGNIDPEEATANCGWGDDGSTLYMTSDMNLCRIKLNTKGKGF